MRRIQREMSLGKLRRLSQCADDGGRFTMLAADQRGNLRRALNPDDPESTTAAELSEFKVELSRSLSSSASAILLDPEFGAAQAIAAGAVSGSTGLIVALEATGYEASPHDRSSTILPGWSAQQAAELGAAAAKLLVYFHPEAGGAAAQIELVAETANACAAVDLPLVVEPLSFSLGQSPLDGRQKRDVVVETAAILGATDGVDMLKMEFPALPDEPETWVESCADLDEKSPVPWVLLSAGVDFDTFLSQAEVACGAGASGVLAGRAVWKESVGMSLDDRRTFYATIGMDRLSDLTRVVRADAQPWRSYSDGQEIQSDWYAGG